jgi:gluconolactonase
MPRSSLSLALVALVVSSLVRATLAVELPLEPIKGVLAADTKAVVIKEGLNGTEGPVRLADGTMLFTENRADRIIRIAADDTTATHLENTNGSNALALNPQGELVSVQTTKPALGVIQPADKARTLASGYQSAPFGRPNDVVISRRGSVYFSDPNATPSAVYLLPREGAELQRIATGIERPNGVALSPDDRTLYVANSGGEWVIAFDLARDGTVRKQRDFAHLAGITRNDAGAVAGGADGLAVDAAGRVYVATGAGVQVFTAKGAALGTIKLPNAPQNLAFGGARRDQLYVVGRGSVYRIPTLTKGPSGRGK